MVRGGGIAGPRPDARDGQYTDPETGLIYLRARYDDPTTGQFISRDPLGAITRSPYGYVDGDPHNATDPFGLWGWNNIRKFVHDMARRSLSAQPSWAL